MTTIEYLLAHLAYRSIDGNSLSIYLLVGLVDSKVLIGTSQKQSKHSYVAIPFFPELCHGSLALHYTEGLWQESNFLSQ